MSRNFDLLERASEERRKAGAWETPPPISPTYEMRPVPDVRSLPQEQLVRLVQSVFLSRQQKAPKAVIFTGVEGGAGCSSICAGVGEALAAQTEERVCIVDSNLRRPSLHQCFGVNNQQGLSEALLSCAPIHDFVRALPGGKLWLLPSGLASSRLMGAMSFKRLATRISELRLQFSYLVMDSPPITFYSDAISLAQLADGVVLVLAANSTRREAARRAKDSLHNARARLLGSVLNKRTYPVPKMIYDRL